jgi:hypothetical protein
MKRILMLVVTAVSMLAASSSCLAAAPGGAIVGPNASFYGAWNVRLKTPWDLRPRDMLWVWRGGELLGQADVIEGTGVAAVVLPRHFTPRKGDGITFYHRAFQPLTPQVDNGVASDPYWQLDDIANQAACREFVQIAKMPFGSFPPSMVWGVPGGYPGSAAAPRR